MFGVVPQLPALRIYNFQPLRGLLLHAAVILMRVLETPLNLSITSKHTETLKGKLLPKKCLCHEI
jgi:hypothetical protein